MELVEQLKSLRNKHREIHATLIKEGRCVQCDIHLEGNICQACFWEEVDLVDGLELAVQGSRLEVMDVLEFHMREALKRGGDEDLRIAQETITDILTELVGVVK